MKIDDIRGLLGLARRAKGLTIGSRETRAGMHRGEVSLVLLAEDGSPRDRERIGRVAEEEEVPLVPAGSREELGAAIGQGAVSVLGIRDRNLAAGITERLRKREESGPKARKRPGGEKP